MSMLRRRRCPAQLPLFTGLLTRNHRRVRHGRLCRPMFSRRWCSCLRNSSGIIAPGAAPRERPRRRAMSDKIKPQHLARKAMLYVRQSSAYQVTTTWRVRSCSTRCRTGSGSWGGARSRSWMRTWAGRPRDGHARGVRAHGLGGLPGQGGRRGRPGGLAVRAQQPGVAATDGGLPDRRHRPDRPGNGLRAPAKQRSAPVGPEGQPERVRAGPPAAALRGSPLRQGAARRSLQAVPVGYVKTEDQRWRRTRTAGSSRPSPGIPESSLELGTVRQTLWWFLEHGLRYTAGPPGENTLEAARVTTTLCTMLTNPVYGGAYAYGKTEQCRAMRRESRAISVAASPANVVALNPELHEGYVSWEEFEQIRRDSGEQRSAKGAWLRSKERTSIVNRTLAMLCGADVS